MTDSLPRSSDSWFQTLDRVLRGGFVAAAADDSAADVVTVPARRLLGLGVILGLVAGACAGAFALFHGLDHPLLRVLVSAGKVPLLFVLTVLVTLPSLYVFSALQRLPVDFATVVRVLLLAILVHLGVTASLGPVFAFFCASTTSYPFLLLLNVLFFAIGGFLGFSVLRQALADIEQRTRRILTMWCVVYAIVGLQMGWLLRPFVGRPGDPFVVFTAPDGNALTGLFEVIGQLFGG